MAERDVMFFGGGVMWVFWVFMLALLIWLVMSIAPGKSDSKSSAEDTPLVILKKRYALGEINQEEYERRRKDLEG